VLTPNVVGVRVHSQFCWEFVLCPENHCTVKKLSNNVAAVKCKAGDAGMLLLLKGKLSIRKSEIITFVVD
jgi:hypothetical protein